MANKLNCIISMYREVVFLFNISKPEMINKTFRIPKAVIDELSKVAQKKKVSLNYLVIKCCEYALENMLDEDEQKTE